MKIRYLLLMILVLTCFSISVVKDCDAKWQKSETVSFNGHLGVLDMSVETLEIDLSDEPLVPGWCDEFEIDVTNVGNIEFDLSASAQKVPSFLDVILDCPSSVEIGETVKLGVKVCVDSDTDISLVGSDAGFDVVLKAIQK